MCRLPIFLVLRSIVDLLVVFEILPFKLLHTCAAHTWTFQMPLQTRRQTHFFVLSVSFPFFFSQKKTPLSAFDRNCSELSLRNIRGDSCAGQRAGVHENGVFSTFLLILITRYS